MNKLLTVGATILFICLAFTPEITADETNFGNILYVGGTGPGNYSRIQDAINDASEGDTVFAYSGTYYENLLLYDKNMINLIGESKDNTVIDGGDKNNVIHINQCTEISISNFKIENSKKGNNNGLQYAGILISNCNDILLENNKIIHNEVGVVIDDGNWTEIMYNNISNNEGGIFVNPSDLTMIWRNDIGFNREDGIRLNKAGEVGIVYNNINLNSHSGIYLYRSPVIIYNNRIERNLYGLYVPTILAFFNNTVYCNNFINNGENVFDNCFLMNRYINNFWDDWIGLKYENLNFLPYKISWFKFDLSPEKEPYDIPLWEVAS